MANNVAKNVSDEAVSKDALKELNENPDKLLELMNEVTRPEENNKEDDTEDEEVNEVEDLDDEQADEPEEEEVKPKRKSANERIRELIAANKKLKEELSTREVEEYETVTTAKPKKEDKRPTYGTDIPDDFDKQKILSLISSKNPDDLIEGLKLVSKISAKQVVGGAIEKVMPTVSKVALKEKALEDGIDFKELVSVFKKHPKLAEDEAGYEIAKDLLKATKKSTPKQTTIKGKSASSMYTTDKSGKKVLDKTEFDKQLLRSLKGK